MSVSALLFKLVARSKSLTEASLFATSKLAATLLRLIDAGLAAPAEEIARQFQRRMEARTTSAEADAKKRMAEAVSAVNAAEERKALHEINLTKQKDLAAIAKAALKAKELQVAEKARRIELAELRFESAVKKLKASNGKLYLDHSALKKLKSQKG